MWRLYPSARGIPEMEFRLAAAYRALDERAQALRIYRRFADWPADSLWGINARAELSLAGKGKMPLSKPLLRARRTSRPPVLDGRLDEPAWRFPGTPIPAVVHPGAPAPRHAATIRVLYDEEALYLAFEGRLLGKPTEDEAQRLERQGYGFGSSLHLLLDINRDYATNLHFSLRLPAVKGEVFSSEGVTLKVPWRVRTSLRADRFIAEWAIDLLGLEVYRVGPRSVWGINLGVDHGDGTRLRFNGSNDLDAVPAFGYLVFGK